MFLIMKNQITNYMIPFWRMYTHKYIHTQTKKKKTIRRLYRNIRDYSCMGEFGISYLQPFSHQCFLNFLSRTHINYELRKKLLKSILQFAQENYIFVSILLIPKQNFHLINPLGKDRCEKSHNKAFSIIENFINRKSYCSKARENN